MRDEKREARSEQRVEVTDQQQLEVHPLTMDRWPDLEELFGERGACGGCWCMYWVFRHATFQLEKGAGNKAALRARVAGDDRPGLLGYLDGRPVAWCALQPRECYPVLERSRVLARVDEQPVWSLPCLFVARPFRRQGLSLLMLRGAVDYAARQGAAIIEAYPIDPRRPNMPDPFVWTGLAATFRKAGFVEVARRSETRPIMRYSCEK